MKFDKRRGARASVLALAVALGLGAPAVVSAQAQRAETAAPARPWMNTSLSADQRAALLVRQMTEEEKLRLVFGYFGSPDKSKNYTPVAEARMGSAGYVPGIPRLGVPPQWETDAGVGVATQRDSLEPYRLRTSLPAGIATTATWNPELAFAGGKMIGSEARDSGFNVMLAGGVNLVREPRNGRNFEYGGEDPLLAGVMVGQQIRGIESNNIVSTIKHFALNAQETGRMVVSSNIADDQARMSDLLAFEIAMEISDPGSVMCAYNRVNSVYACESEYLLNDVLKGDWGYKGYVMSDWGAVHSTAKSINAGLDQQSAYTFDKEPFFNEPLKKAIASGEVSRARLDDMATRIVRALFAKGVIDNPVEIRPIDFEANAKVTQADAEEAIVLLKNEGGALPLARTAKRIAVIGGFADKGVMAGGGSSMVFPIGGGFVDPEGPKGWPGPILYHPPAPLDAIRAMAPGATVRFDAGRDPAAAAKLAVDSDVVIFFGTQWATESQDSPIKLDRNQDEVIAAVAAANPKTVVVLQTGGPVLMPWLDRVPAVMEAWYSGTRGAHAIARVLFGEVNPSGRLPVTFPKSLDQTPSPTLAGTGLPSDQMFDVTYKEGAAVGYKWFDKQGHEPLFPFGYGLSYTTFDYGDLSAQPRDGGLSVSLKVRNTGRVSGKAVPQVYVGPVAGGWEAPRRLAGWSKVELQPNGEQAVTVQVDPRLLATFDSASKTWRIAPGEYDVSLGASSRDFKQKVRVRLNGSTLPVSYDPK
jgi:beta-glucosidase